MKRIDGNERVKGWVTSATQWKTFCCYLFLFLLTGACIDPLPLTLSASDQVLIVDGMITDQPGPYEVKIFHSTLANTQVGNFDWIKKALVTITDSDGVSEVLTEKTPGNYQTATMQGVTGKSYTLKIITGDGASYESSAEVLLPVGDFGLNAEFVQNEPVDPYNLKTTNGYNILVDTKILSEQEGRVRWRWTGTYEVLTFPELHTIKQISKSGAVIDVAAPFQCSGFIATGPFSIRRIGLSTCSECWVTERNDAPLITASGFEGKDSVTRNLSFIPANRRLFYKKYHLDVEQLSLSKVSYDFWRNVAAQRASGSDLFQTPPAKTIGNISASGANAQKVIGLFSASSVKKHTIVIEHSQVPIYVPVIDTLKQECYYAYINSSKTKPSFY